MLRSRPVVDRAAVVLRGVLPLAALLIEGPTALLGALLVQEGGLWLARRLAGTTGDASFAARLFLGAYALRAAVAMALHTYLLATQGHGAVLQDDYTYDLVAQWLVRVNLGGEGLSIFTGHQHLLDSAYLYLVTALYAVLGYVPIVPKLLNAALGALCAVLVAEIGGHAFRPTVGRLAGIGAAIVPSLVLWSAVTLKEMLVLFAIVAGLRSIQALAEPHPEPGGRANVAVGAVAVLTLVHTLRFPSFLILVALMPIVLLARWSRYLRPSGVALAALAVVVLAAGTLAVSRARLPDSTLAKLSYPDEIVRTLSHRRAKEAITARTQIGSGVDIASREVLEVPGFREPELFSVVDDVLEPLGLALLAPAPWQARSLRDLVASGEMVVWYVLLGAALAAWLARPAQPAFVVALALYGLATWVLLAFAEGNLGNLLRHRIMLVPPALVLGSAGLLALWPRVRDAARLGRIRPAGAGARPGSLVPRAAADAAPPPGAASASHERSGA